MFIVSLILFESEVKARNVLKLNNVLRDQDIECNCIVIEQVIVVDVVIHTPEYHVNRSENNIKEQAMNKLKFPIKMIEITIHQFMIPAS